jgi:hypothetical protein
MFSASASMENSEPRLPRMRALIAMSVALLFCGWPSALSAQQQAQGFALERLYPSAPAGGWFVMDDLNMSGGLGGAVSFISGYSRRPLQVKNPNGTQQLSVVSDEVFADIGVAGTYRRYRFYLNFPMPLLLNGTSGTVGPYQFTAPDVNVGSRPDTISDPLIGLNVRLFGEPGDVLRLGIGAQLMFPAGDQADYTTDGTYRGMFRLLAAGDAGRFSYAGHIGVHVRPLDQSPVPGGPDGSEFLFGGSAGRRFGINSGWAVIAGPEIFGETAFHAFFSGQTGVEGLLTGRLERVNDGPHLRFKLGIGHGIVHNFGAPQWRTVFGVELFGQGPVK